MKNQRIAQIENVLECNELSPKERTQKFDHIIDVRTPAEFALDHIPGAINCPVLSNEQRIIVGTIYKQQSAFEANKVGAAMIARAIAEHIDQTFSQYPKDWKPLIYCWRGGGRSGAMAHILNKIGWQAHIVQGGYKAYRRHVVAQLKELPKQFKFKVISGSTGSGKSRLLEEIAKLGGQVLDLEALANHKGSVLGITDEAQPSQKWFETQIHAGLSKFDPNQTVFVESESRKVGRLHLPDELLLHMRSSPCIEIQASLEERVAFLKEDYAVYIQSPELLIKQLTFIKEILGAQVLEGWKGLIHEQRWDEFISDLLEKHYDPLYLKSHQNFDQSKTANTFTNVQLNQQYLSQLAEKLIHTE
jgi:tRNA 2-selenouridine synthase